MATTQVTSDRQVVVEGRDAFYFFEALRRYLALNDLQIHDGGGVSQIRGFLKALVRAPGFQRVRAVGVVRDAEIDPRAARQSALDALAAAGLGGSHQDARTAALRTGVLILPDDVTPGSLEDLCFRAVSGDPVLDCVDEYLKCTVGATAKRPRNLTKARMHAYLAALEQPYLLLGRAAQLGVWDWQQPALASALAFLRDL